MKSIPLLLLPITIGLLNGCALQTYQPEQRSPVVTASSNTLTIYDVAQNVLTDEKIPVRGWTPLEIVLREGAHEESKGVFVKINGNVRFVPWQDLIADPLGQRFYSDAFVKAGELTLRITKAPCGGRLPLIFQVRELRPKVMPAGSPIKPSLEDIGYEPLSSWTESGLYLPENLAGHIDGRWDDQECQPSSTPPHAAFIQQTLLASLDGRPGIPDQQIATLSTAGPEVEKKELDPWGKPCRLCRKEESDNDHGRGDHQENGRHM